MNGRAITKRHEVRDADTGEAVTGAYVLVPEDGAFAETTMFVYASLCGLGDEQKRAVATFADPQSDEGWRPLRVVAEAALAVDLVEERL